ncbi:tape measure protein [Stenotrophomonas phage Sonora]|nr:tape measure protein [Stenotrophomonas phage Sonora]
MTTERIDIIVSERGSRVVRKNVESIGEGARQSASGVDLLKRALAGLGLAAIAREALKAIDAFTNLQNRLRSTGLEGKNLTGVYQALLKVANETRSSVEGSVELYSRLAISSKELGVSQQQLIDFTKSLNQAIILSGASAAEAQAGLVQLSQGMASGTLRGDELRSVLEQLPAVADVIAKKLGVTRGELRKMGEDGKITARTILEAFQASREELDERFGKTLPTLSQSFQVLKNNVLDMIGRFDQATGISETLSKALLFIAENVDAIAKGFAAIAIGITAVGTTVTVINSVRNAVIALNVAIAANPIGLLATALSVLITALVSAVAAIVLFRDEINLGIDDVTSLGDYLRALGEIAQDLFNDIVRWAEAAFGPLIAQVRAFFSEFDVSIAGFLRVVARAMDVFVGGNLAAIKTVLTVWNGFGPALQDIVVSAINVILGKLSDFVNKVGEILSPITDAAGLGKITAVDLKIDSDTEGAAKQFGKDLSDAIQSGAKFDAFSSSLEGVFSRAQEIGAARRAAEAANGGAVSGIAPAGANLPGADDGKASKARKRMMDELERLVGQYDRVYAAQMELKDATELLDKAEAAGMITAKRKAEVLGLINDQLKDALDPIGAVNRELQKELDLLKLTTEAREVEVQMRSIQDDLRSQGVKIGDEELKQMREKLVLIQQQNALDEARNRMLQDSRSGRDKQFGVDAQALKELQEQNKIDPKDQYEILNGMLGGSLEGTQAELDARASQMEEYFARIQLLRDQNIINEQTASDAIKAIKADEMDFYLQRTATALGATAQLMQTNSKKAFEAGRAAAIGQAIVNTYTAATAAYQSAAAIPYVGWLLGPAAAAGAIAAGMAQVSAIRSQQMPAYRTGGEYVVGGHGGVDSQTVSMRASPGERISINTPSQAHAMENMERMMKEGGAGGRGDFTQNLTIVQQGRPNRRTTEQEARKVRKAAQMEYEA